MLEDEFKDIENLAFDLKSSQSGNLTLISEDDQESYSKTVSDYGVVEEDWERAFFEENLTNVNEKSITTRMKTIKRIED